MKRRIIAFFLLLIILACIPSCDKKAAKSTFSIHFIDVGQGDAALIECDGHYMLIDGGDKSAEDKVYEVVKEALEKKGKRHLDILALSHLHADHIGGLEKTLDYLSSIGLVISNSNDSNTDTFLNIESALHRIGSKIKVPPNGKEYNLGSAKVKVLDTCADEDNDSLVLLITYGKTRFLFTGDIMAKGQVRVRKALQEGKDFLSDNRDWDSLIKLPHHGAYNDKHEFQDSNLNALLYEYDPNYIIISVGAGNIYNHPHQETLNLINKLVESKNLSCNSHVFRTDLNGNIVIKSNGKQITIE